MHSSSPSGSQTPTSDTLTIYNDLSGCQDLTYLLTTYVDDSPGEIVDTEGGTSRVNYADSRYRGNVYAVSNSTTLKRIESYLNFTGYRNLDFVVFRSDALWGSYSRVYQQTAAVSGIGAGFYSSNPFALPLVEGQFYIVAVGWTGGNATFYWDITPVPHDVSFGQKHYGFGYAGYPIGTTIANPDFLNGDYYQETDDGGDVAYGDRSNRGGRAGSGGVRHRNGERCGLGGGFSFRPIDNSK